MNHPDIPADAKVIKVCDCFPWLKDLTNAREQRYQQSPDRPAPEGPQSKLEIKLVSIGNLNERVKCKNSGHSFLISEPAHVGGDVSAPTPLEYLLSGAVGCYAAVFAFYAAKMDVSYDSFEVVARATLDVRGHMIPDAPPSGFQELTMDILVSSSAPSERLKEVERLALAGCPGISTLRNPVEIKSNLTIQRSA
jgi:uncharacterized OsmC-like protein